MSILYYPQKLQHARIDVEKLHTKVSRYTISEEDADLKYLIEKLVAQKKDQVLPYAKVLDDTQISQVAEYLCYNYWHKPLENLEHLLIHRASKEDWAVIFTNWQNRYNRGENREEIKEFIAQSLKTNPNFKIYLTAMLLNERQLQWISAKDFVDILCSNCAKVLNEDAYTRELLNHGLIKETELFNTCFAKYYIYCDKRVLLAVPTGTLLQAFQRMNNDDKILFCRSLLDKLELKDLLPKRLLFDQIDSLSVRGIQLKKELSVSQYDKFHQWKMYYEIETTFEGDKPRKEFWLGYIGMAEEVVRYPMRAPEIMYIVVGNYVAVEFVNKAAGPAYLYRKKYFDSVVKRRMTTMSKTEFQKWELEISKTQPNYCLKRVPHMSGWQGELSNTLGRYGIYPAAYE